MHTMQCRMEEVTHTNSEPDTADTVLDVYGRRNQKRTFENQTVIREFSRLADRFGASSP